MAEGNCDSNQARKPVIPYRAVGEAVVAIVCGVVRVVAVGLVDPYVEYGYFGDLRAEKIDWIGWIKHIEEEIKAETRRKRKKIRVDMLCFVLLCRQLSKRADASTDEDSKCRMEEMMITRNEKITNSVLDSLYPIYTSALEDQF